MCVQYAIFLHIDNHVLLLHLSQPSLCIFIILSKILSIVIQLFTIFKSFTDMVTESVEKVRRAILTVQPVQPPDFISLVFFTSSSLWPYLAVAFLSYNKPFQLL
ncbi:hypothetical protein COCON_G00135630 [Conger conger]|uniref:Uncharacterized protein n=1 Tax=Conger conger TaxID=82655 RepID=A0A9Q1HXL3_CONCO|nr:hypothetical protein COCON_G00135630 [Conger conger]